MYSSACFGRPRAHHQELNKSSGSLWFYCWSVVIAVLLVVVGPAQPRPKALLSPRSNSKTRGCYCSCWAPDGGCEDAQNMLSCTQTSSNKLEKMLHIVGWFIGRVIWGLYSISKILWNITSYLKQGVTSHMTLTFVNFYEPKNLISKCKKTVINCKIV